MSTPDFLLQIPVEGPIAITFAAPASAITAGVSAAATSLPVTGGTGTNFQPGQLILLDAGSPAEIVRVVAVAANTLTVTPCSGAHLNGALIGTALIYGLGHGQVNPSPWPQLQPGSF